MTYIENMGYDHISSLVERNLFKHLKDNEFYQRRLKQKKTIFHFGSKETSFFLMDILFVAYYEDEDIWKIQVSSDLSNNSLDRMLLHLQKDNGLMNLVDDIREIVELLVSLISENSDCFGIDTEQAFSFMKRVEITLKLKEEINQNYNYKSYISSINRHIVLVIPDIDAIIIPAEIEDELTGVKVLENIIYLPFNIEEDVDLQLSSYFEKHELLNHLKSVTLHNIITKEEAEKSHQEIFNNFIRSRVKTVFGDTKGRDYYADFLTINPNIDFNEIQLFYKLVEVPCILLPDAAPIMSTSNNTEVLKTHSGIYYLRKDFETFGFKTLNEVYGEFEVE